MGVSHAPHRQGASAGAAPLPRVAALQPDRAGAGRGSAGRSVALPESPSARHLPHAQHSPPRVWGMCRLPHPASRLPTAWPTGAPQPEETAPSIFRPRLRAHGVGQRCQSHGEPPRGHCLGCSCGAQARAGTGHRALPGWHSGCGKGSPPVPAPAPVPDGSVQPLSVPAWGFTGLPSHSCGSFVKRSGMSMVGDAPPCPPATSPWPHRLTAAPAALDTAGLAPCWGGLIRGQDPSPGPHVREGGSVQGGARRGASRHRQPRPRGCPPRTYPRAAGALGRAGRSPSACAVPSCKSLPANDRDKNFNGNNRKQLLSSDRSSLTTGDV